MSMQAITKLTAEIAQLKAQLDAQAETITRKARENLDLHRRLDATRKEMDRLRTYRRIDAHAQIFGSK